MGKFRTIIIGGGAAGIVAGITAGRREKSVLICERMPQLGRKILATGGGRCNLLNEQIDEFFYNPRARLLVKTIFSRFDFANIKKFFSELGLEVYSENGRIFPRTNQSASVLKVLEMEVKRLSIPVELNFCVADIRESEGKFIVTSKGDKKIECSKLIIASGGKSYPALGSDGSCYKFARQFGHKIIEPVPVAVPILVKDPLCHLLQGQKILAGVKSIINDKVTGEVCGDLLFTKYGLSGTSILDISEDISIALNRHKEKNVIVSIDMIPFMSKDEFVNELMRRINRGDQPEDLLSGILPEKFGGAFRDLLRARNIDKMGNILKGKQFKVSGTRGWNEAEFTAGGIDTTEVNESTLESKLKRGIYFAGEILDVQGKRGGYNLAWAWASGMVAGFNQ